MSINRNTPRIRVDDVKTKHIPFKWLCMCITTERTYFLEQLEICKTNVWTECGDHILKLMLYISVLLRLLSKTFWNLHITHWKYHYPALNIDWLMMNRLNSKKPKSIDSGHLCLDWLLWKEIWISLHKGMEAGIRRIGALCQRTARAQPVTHQLNTWWRPDIATEQAVEQAVEVLVIGNTITTKFRHSL